MPLAWSVSIIMHRLICVVLVVALVAGSFPLVAGAQGISCESPDESWQDPRSFDDERFSSLFPGLDLMVSADRSRLPEIPRLWVSGPDGDCSLQALPGLLAADDRTLESQGDLESAAWLAALAGDTEVMGVSQLERVVSFERTGDDAARVVLQALSPATGSRVQWTVDVEADGDTEARWVVLELVPEARSQDHGWFLEAGDEGPFEEAPGEANTEVKLYETHDGKSIRITYFLDRYDSVEEAEEDADRNGEGGVLAYNLINDVWGFPSADPDGFLDITVNGCACISGGDQVAIRMPPNVMEWVNSIGFSYTDPDEVAYLIIAHEFFHHFQYSMMQWNQANWVTEGTARFIETIIYPSETHQPGSIQYGGGLNGFPAVMENPHYRPQQHSYSYGLVWGHIYDHNGGVEFFKRLFEESAADPSFPGFIDRALVSMGGEHESFADALADIGERLVSKSFEWDTWDGAETRDWGLYLPDLTTQGLLGVGNVGQWETNVEAYAMRFLELPSAGFPAGATTIATSGAPAVRTLVVTEDGDGFSSQEFQSAYAGAPGPFVQRHLFILNDPDADSPVPQPPGQQFRALVATV